MKGITILFDDERLYRDLEAESAKAPTEEAFETWINRIFRIFYSVFDPVYPVYRCE